MNAWAEVLGEGAGVAGAAGGGVMGTLKNSLDVARAETKLHEADERCRKLGASLDKALAAAFHSSKRALEAEALVVRLLVRYFST